MGSECFDGLFRHFELFEKLEVSRFDGRQLSHQVELRAVWVDVADVIVSHPDQSPLLKMLLGEEAFLFLLTFFPPRL